MLSTYHYICTNVMAPLGVIIKMTEKNTDNKLTGRLSSLFSYLTTGIWSDPRRSWWLNILRIANLSVNSFLNRDIQTQASALTYRTLLAVVPALALLLAIGRGFGMQQVLQDELYKLFPAQHTAIKYAMNFIESYLQQTSEGIFVGIGIMFLLWTLISLLGNVEDTFNLIWGQKSGRSIWRKLSDYTAMLLILPVLMICASGISLLLSSTLNSIFDFEFMTPVISGLLEGAQCVMTFLFFTAVYMLIPNTKVKFKNAVISGCLCGCGFLVLQWLFVTGTLYVTRYNAIYGSFAFIPLLLLWMQLAWVICLAGAVICYSSQNVFAFSLDREVSSISNSYRDKVTVAISAAIAYRFKNRLGPATARDLMDNFDLPARLVTTVTDRLVAVGICSRVLIPGQKETYGLQLAIDPDKLTVGELRRELYNLGASDFIANFDHNFPKVISTFDRLDKAFADVADTIPVASLIDNIPTSNTDRQ